MTLQRSGLMLRVLGRVVGAQARQNISSNAKLWMLKPNRFLHHCGCVTNINRPEPRSNCAFRLKECEPMPSDALMLREYRLTWSQVAAFATDSKRTSQPIDTNTANKTSDVKLENSDDAEEEEDEKSLTVFQRFKRAYKKHGKVLIGVHVATSCVWFGSFFYAAHMGVDVIPLMEKIGFSDTIIRPFRSSSIGDVALAYLMYKLATPARYTVTLGGTNYMIKYLRHTGKMEPKQESLRELVKDSRAEMREKTDMFKSKFGSSQETKDVNDDIDESKQKNSHRVDR